LQAVLDESFLYIRLSSKTELPAVGLKIETQGNTGAPPLPYITVEITPGQEQTGGETKQFGIFVGDIITIKGGATPRYSVNYSMTFKHKGKKVFYCHATSLNRLLEIKGKLIDIKIPRDNLGLKEGDSLQLILSGPVSGFLPYTPKRL
jgi:hypothetical protein